MNDAESKVREKVRRRYADAALSVDSGCCDTDCCGTDKAEVFEIADSGDFGKWLYQAEQLAAIPSGAALASLGCGNPTAVAEMRPGETVLDLGSGAGIDVLLSAQRVGPTGFAFGIDMTDEMIDLARKHQAEAGATNVEFRKGEIESIPLDDAMVEVIISNCVINLSPDKPAAFAEMYRVLKPGGRLGLSDVVADDALTSAERLERGDWVGCVAGALSFTEYEEGLRSVGFTEISIEATHEVADRMHSATIKAAKPST